MPGDTAVGIAFRGKDEVTPVVRGIRSTMDRFKRDAKAGFGLAAGFSVWGQATRAVGVFADYMGEAIQAAAEEEAQIAQLTRALEENDEAWDGNIQAVEDVIRARQDLAFEDNEQRESLRALVAVTRDSTEALRVQGIAMDLARLRNIDLATASQLLGKVYGGNVSILRRYGIQVDKNADAATALAAVQRMAAGQAETYANTTAGVIETVQIQLGELQEDIGVRLLPVARDFALVVRDSIIPALSAMAGELDPIIDLLLQFQGSSLDQVRAQQLAAEVTNRLRQQYSFTEQQLGTYQMTLAGALAMEGVMADETKRNLAIQSLFTGILGNTSEALGWVISHAGDAGQAIAGLIPPTVEETARLKALSAALDAFASGGLFPAKRTDDERKALERLKKPGDQLLQGRNKAQRAVEMYGRQAKRALRDEDVEAWALARSRQQQAQARLDQHRTLIQQFRDERKGIVRTTDKVEDAKQAIIDLRTEAEKGIHTKATVDMSDWDRLEARMRRLGLGPLPDMDSIPTTTPGRQHGGPVAAGRTYLVGERGPELLHMGAASGSITPNQAIGGGDIVVNIDGHQLVRILDARMGKRYSLTGRGSYYRSAD